MAPPDLTRLSRLEEKTAVYTCTDTLSEVLTCVASTNTNRALKINYIRVTSLDSGNTVTSRVTRSLFGYYPANPTQRVDFNISVLSLSPNESATVVNRDTYFYLQEGESIYASCDVSGAVSLTIGYEELTQAHD